MLLCHTAQHDVSTLWTLDPVFLTALKVEIGALLPADTEYAYIVPRGATAGSIVRQDNEWGNMG